MKKTATLMKDSLLKMSVLLGREERGKENKIEGNGGGTVAWKSWAYALGQSLSTGSSGRSVFTRDDPPNLLNCFSS